MSFTIFQKEKSSLQATKTTSSKSRKIDIFPKELTHGFSPKMAIFPTVFLKKIQARKMSLTIFQNEKTPFQALKTTSLGPKIIFFPTFFFQEIQARKMFFTIFQNGETPFQAIKKKSSKTQKINIFPNRLTHGFGPKMAIFVTFFFQATQATKMSFTIFQNEKTPFQAIETTSSKS